MAAILDDIHHAADRMYFNAASIRRLGKKLYAALSHTRSNPSPFPDRVWARHSALLDSAWKQSRKDLA